LIYTVDIAAVAVLGTAHFHTGRKMTIRTEEKDEEVEVEVAADGNNGNEFPDAYYCPLTKNIMVDPVVDTNGESFERSAVIARDEREKVTGVTYYPNRALKAIVEREVERHEEKGSMKGRVLALEESLRSGFGRLVDKSVLPMEYRPLPDSFYCPITLELIRKPVIDPDGKTFERDAISNWIRANGTSPVTRNVLAVNQLRNNEALQDLIEEEKERTDESIHPSIRRWKMEAPTIETGDQEETGNEQSYPTTQAEIDARRRRSANCSPVGIIFLVIVILAAFIVFPAQAFFLVWALTCCCFAASCVSNATNRTPEE
jgi:hypothetical protein